MPFDHRGMRADEQLEIFELLFTERSPSYSGRFYEFPPVEFEPKPVQRPIPLWIGGSSEPAFRRAARVGDCFHAAFEPQETVSYEWQRVRDLATERGRAATELSLSVRLYLDPESRMPAPVSIAGSTERMIHTMSEWAAVGAGHVLVDITAPGGPEGRLEALRHFMLDVVPRVEPPELG
jgi:alkanesulfonate monooxygenase SsuD/methylene tetrahydromethanopterin reductase-like flavin-dependent oxidoreductase (luciferase family)